MPAILDHTGQPINRPYETERPISVLSREEVKGEVLRLRHKVHQMIKAKYDASQTTSGNELHWGQADHLDPHAANSLGVRRRLRDRARYEVHGNNCYLQGILITIANDFVGSGPRLQITDPRISKERRRHIEELYHERCRKIKLRQKLWQWVIAKKVSGEAVGVAYTNARLKHPVKVDWEVIETDQMSHAFDAVDPQKNEVDGIKFDENFQPVQYHILNQHPGSMFLFNFKNQFEGQWIDEKYIIHWIRRDRPWLRAIPELTPSLPLCSVLRRYTLAVLSAAEFAASVSGVLKTNGPANNTFWSAFETLGAATGGEEFPIERNMFLTLPYTYELEQIEAKHPMQNYDQFVNALIREIVRPLLIPYNRAVGSSKDSNMASGVVDEQTYKAGIEFERQDCEDDVLEKDLNLWWMEGIRTEDYFDDFIPFSGKTGRRTMRNDFAAVIMENPSLRFDPPRHIFRWGQVGLEHTDPNKVAQSRKTNWEMGFRTTEDIVEEDFNQPFEVWQEKMAEEVRIRKQLGLPTPGQDVLTQAKMAENAEDDARREDQDVPSSQKDIEQE